MGRRLSRLGPGTGIRKRGEREAFLDKAGEIRAVILQGLHQHIG